MQSASYLHAASFFQPRQRITSKAGASFFLRDFPLAGVLPATTAHAALSKMNNQVVQLTFSRVVPALKNC